MSDNGDKFWGISRKGRDEIFDEKVQESLELFFQIVEWQQSDGFQSGTVNLKWY